MMTATSFVRVVGFAALLTNNVFVVVVGTTFDSSVDCSNELVSCTSESTCLACFREFSAAFGSATSDSTTEFSECLADNLDDTTSVSTCEMFEVIECCFPDDCFENEDFSSLWECSLESDGCSTEDFSCDETLTDATTSTEDLSSDETSTAATSEDLSSDETSTAATTSTIGTTMLSYLVCAILLMFTLVDMSL